MTSGIYMLTFPSGRTYIGKSINIPNRWVQHRDKLSRGTAAKLMQDEFNRFGDFEGEVLFECHPDHIDILEAMFISRIKPELNGTAPADPFEGLTPPEIDSIANWFHQSTIEHVTSIITITEALERIKELHKDAVKQIESLSAYRSKEEIETTVGFRIIKLQKELEEEQAKNRDLTSSLKLAIQRINYLSIPWWKKVFI